MPQKWNICHGSTVEIMASVGESRMLKISKEWVQEILKAKDIDMRKLASNPVIYEKACTIAYKAILSGMNMSGKSLLVNKSLRSIIELRRTLWPT